MKTLFVMLALGFAVIGGATAIYATTSTPAMACGTSAC